MLKESNASPGFLMAPKKNPVSIPKVSDDWPKVSVVI